MFRSQPEEDLIAWREKNTDQNHTEKKKKKEPHRGLRKGCECCAGGGKIVTRIIAIYNSCVKSCFSCFTYILNNLHNDYWRPEVRGKARLL